MPALSFPAWPSKSPNAIGSIVYLDAFYPEDGERMVDITGPQVREATLAAADKGEFRRAARPAEVFQVNEKDRAWVDAMCRPHPIGTMIEAIRLTGARERIAKKQLHPRPRLSQSGLRQGGGDG